MSTPWMNVSGLRIETSAPAAVKFTMRLIQLPTMLDTAMIIWLDVPCRAWMTSASVWALGASWRNRLPKG
ncbi:hypothetical protein FQZ97_519350 [compost metagenome]